MIDLSLPETAFEDVVLATTALLETEVVGFAKEDAVATVEDPFSFDVTLFEGSSSTLNWCGSPSFQTIRLIRLSALLRVSIARLLETLVDETEALAEGAPAG